MKLFHKPGKLFIIGAITIALLIANACLFGLLSERETAYDNAKDSIAEAAGDRYRQEGIYLAIPYGRYKDIIGRNGQTVRELVTEYQIISPEIISLDAKLKTEKRKLGIYSAPIFSGTVNAKATFNIMEVLKTSPNRIWKLNHAMLIIEISDQSLTSRPTFTINKKNYATNFSKINSDISNLTSSVQGIAAEFRLNENTENLEFETTLDIRGAKKFLSKINSNQFYMDIQSDWKSPGFTGFSFLPNSHELTDSGFTAHWALPFVNSELDHSAGFSFIDPINSYAKLFRAIKYGFLFIIVPFIVLLLFEFIAKVELNPLNYLLSGAACVIFFLLVIALSEHISFGASYLIGSICSGALVSWYIFALSKKIKFGVMISGVFTALYSYLYFSLQSEDYALLIGSIFAFVLTGILMFFTRNAKMQYCEDFDC